MNSRERVKQTIAGGRADRVPLGFYAVDHDIIERVIGRPTLVRNKVEIQLAFWQGRRDEVAESWKKDTVEFYRKIDCADIILPKEAPLLPPDPSVFETMEKGAPGGGFILGPSHSIAHNTPYDNFMAMLDTYVELRDAY